MTEKQPTTFRQYLGKKFDIIIAPILVSVFIMIFDVVIGLVVLSFVVIMFIICYFIFGKNLEIEKKEKKEEILIFKYYYNREKVVLGLSVFFAGIIIILALTGFCFPCFTGSVIMLITGVVLAKVISPKTVVVEIIKSKDIVDCFWFNRYIRSLEKAGKVKFKYGLLGMLSLVIIFFSLFSLSLLAGEVYRGYSMSVLLFMILIIVTESVFSFTFGCEEIEGCHHRIDDSPSRQLCSQIVTYEHNETLYGFCNPENSDCILFDKNKEK
jgi:hypothetical protein